LDFVEGFGVDKSFAVYIMACGRHGTIYIGVTSDLLTRVRQHKASAFPGFTSRYGVTHLVYYEFHDCAETAITREKKLKAWKREWKCNLIEADNPAWDDIGCLWDHPDYRPDWNGIVPPEDAQPLYDMLDGRKQRAHP
jgi:putative endonuclease